MLPQWLRAIWAIFVVAFNALRWGRSPIPGNLSGPSGPIFPVVYTLGSLFDHWASLEATPLWIPYPPDPFAPWDSRGNAGYWAYGNVNASAEDSFSPFSPTLDIVTEVLLFIGPLFEEVVDSVPLESADYTTPDANDTERAPPVYTDDPATAQVKVIVYSALCIVLLVASLIPHNTPQLVKTWLDDISGKTTREADTRLSSEALRNVASDYDEHRAALAKHDKEWIALAGKAKLDAVDDYPLEMHGLEGAQVVLDIIMDKCEVAEARLASLDIHQRKVENQQRQEMNDVQMDCIQLRTRLHTLRHDMVEENREAELRAEAHGARTEKLQVDVAASEVKVSEAEKLATSKRRYAETLAATLHVANTEKQELEAENQILRQHAVEAEEALEQNRLVRRRDREAMQAQVAAAQAEVVARQEEDAAVIARRRGLEGQHRSVVDNAHQREKSLEAELSAKRTEATSLSRTLDERRAVTDVVAHETHRLRSDNTVKTQHNQDLGERLANAQGSQATLGEDLEHARQTRHDELAALTYTVAGRRSAVAATGQDLSAAELTLQQAEERKMTEVGAAQAEFDRAEAEDKKTLATLHGRRQRRARELASCDARQTALQAEHASLETQGRELEACFEEQAEPWEDMSEERESRQEFRDTQLVQLKAQLTEAEAATCAAQQATAVAKEEAVAAREKVSTDLKEHEGRQKTFNVELARHRTTNGALTSEHATAHAEYEQLQNTNDALVERGMKADEKMDSLPTLTCLVQSAERDRDRKFANRRITPAIASREAILKNMQESIDLVQLTEKALDVEVTKMHKEIHDDKQKLNRRKNELEAEQRKTRTYRAVLQMPLRTPELEYSSGGFSRSPSATPPPETPRLDASVGRPALQDEMDIVESATACR
ncbi:hypothetical protein PsYK624_094570 [Phanerochaete sordida]|uniref:Uncharacterized protein n=1 Tax=Phanerochaete sordida TaxID=48140 RepID=A0A9P3LG23_9APHY|nr:hypothetical protein PsYK624_094570 [Phanerochaete sordida]